MSIINHVHKLQVKGVVRERVNGAVTAHCDCLHQECLGEFGLDAGPPESGMKKETATKEA
jgi:hypothetical protein